MDKEVYTISIQKTYRQYILMKPMENIPEKNELTSLIIKLLPPFILSVMAKIASDYNRGKRVSFLSSTVTVCLAACGAILGYWITRYLEWTEYKMTLTIFFFGLFSDKLFEILFSKKFFNTMFNIAEDWLKENLKLGLNYLTRKKN